MSVYVTHRPEGIWCYRDVADGTQAFSTGSQLFMEFSHAVRKGTDFRWGGSGSSTEARRIYYEGTRPLLVMARGLFSARRSSGIVASSWAFRCFNNGTQEGPRMEYPQSGGPGSFGAGVGIASGEFPAQPVLMTPGDYLEWSVQQFTGSGWVSESLWAEVLSTGWGADA